MSRSEQDMLGQRSIADEVLWGIHTQRALENFPQTGRRAPLPLIHAMAQVKLAACRVNQELGFIAPEKADAIVSACKEITEGRWDSSFPLDALQGGAGTSTHMNVNEVIANRALEILGRCRGEYDCIDPIEDVNRHQSTNDVYPTALKIAMTFACRKLSESVAVLQGALQAKERQLAPIVLMGRTEMEEAVPVTLGGVFSGFADAISRDRWRTAKCEERLRVVNLGGTAVGTGIGAPRRYIFLITEKLREITGLGLSRGENLLSETAFVDSLVEVSGILKAHAANLEKIASDLRRMHLLRLVRLPSLQTGSTIMAGKINPVVLESLIQRMMHVRALDLLVGECASRGSLQICEFLPLLAVSILEAVDILSLSDQMLAAHVSGIEADVDGCHRSVEDSPMVFTAMLGTVGYHGVERLVKEWRDSGGERPRTILERNFGREKVDEALSALRLTRLGEA